MKRSIPFSQGFFSALAFLALASPAVRGAEIAWGATGTVVGESDVSTSGTLVEAVNTSSDGNGTPTTTTVNGVTFTGWATNGGGTFNSPGGRFNLATTAGYFLLSFNGFGSGAAPFSNLTASYQTLLAGGSFSQNSSNANDFTGPITLTISGLTIGDVYEFQWWTNDSRPFSTGPITATTGLTSVSLDPNSTNGAGGVGQFALGTFTADATTQTVVFSTTGNAVLINGFQLRVVPEPSTLALLGVGAVAAALAVRRRRSAL